MKFPRWMERQDTPQERMFLLGITGFGVQYVLGGAGNTHDFLEILPRTDQGTVETYTCFAIRPTIHARGMVKPFDWREPR